MTPLLDVQDLRKLYPVGASGLAARLRRQAVPLLHAVDGVSFTIGRGETVGLVGESGCGKSTLVRLVTRLIDPSAGAIRFDDEEIGAIAAHRFARLPQRARIQLVFQDAEGSLNPRFTAFDAIADPLRRLARLDAAALAARVEEVADLTGLRNALLGRFPHQLSGGQKARVGIARAIAIEPRLLVLDEPTSALDVSVQVVILRLLAELKARLGLSYLFVSHDLNVVRLLCDRVLVMYLGKIVESGPADAVFADPAHPYTKALLSAIPTFEPGAARRRVLLAGEPRSPIDPAPTVCRFYGRCPRGTELCARQMPVLAAAAADHFVACHYPPGAMTAPGDFAADRGGAVSPSPA
jgi:oligopeptide/dipeptide ABC transporter ATP-binding protein